MSSPVRLLSLAVVLLMGCAANKPALSSGSSAAGYPLPGHLVPLLTEHNSYVVPTASLIARAGTAGDKQLATEQLIRRSDLIGSDAWRQSQLPMLHRLYRQSPSTGAWHRRWVDRWQERHLVRIYDALEALGGDAVMAHCRKVAIAEERRPSEKRLALRVLSLAGKAGAKSQRPWAMPATANSELAFEVRKASPTAMAPAERATVIEGELIDFDQVVDQLRPQFEMCYRRAIRQVGRFGAWITVFAQINGDGRVANASVKGDGSEPLSMMNCLQSVLSHAYFVPPASGRATLSIPLTFTVPVLASKATDSPTTPSGRAPSPSP